MEVYLLLFLELLTLAFAEHFFRLSKNSTSFLLVIAFLTILFFVGLRWETGNDWLPYFNYYTFLNDLNDLNSDFEIGYRSFALTFKFLDFSYLGFLFASSFVYLALIFLVFKKQINPILLCLLFFSSYLLGFMGTARQVIAISLTLLAGDQIQKDRLLAGISLILLATLFHQSAIIFIFSIFFKKNTFRTKTYILAVGLSFFVGLYLSNVFSELVQAFAQFQSISSKLAGYSDVAVDNLTSSNFNQFIWYAKRIIFLIFFLYLKPLFVDARLIFALNAYVFSVCIFFAIFPVAPLIGLRLGNYFAIYELFLLAAIPALVEKRYSTISIFLVIFICSQKLYSALFLYESDLYIPYKSIYYNEDFNRNLY